MHILLTTDTIGGVWTFTRELSTVLLADGHTVSLVSFGRLPSASQFEWTNDTSLRHPSAFRYVASTAPLEWMQQNGRTIVDGLPVLVRLIHECRPDIIHSSQFCFGRLRLPLPVIITAHSDVISWAQACDPATLKQTSWLERYCRLVQNGLDDAAAVVAPTRWMLDALRRNFSVLPQAHVVYNGRTISPETSASSRRQQAVSIGRLWDKAKNLALLAERSYPVPILVAGEMDHEDGKAQGVGSLRVLGTLDEHPLLSLYRSSSLYLGPSLYEPFGLAPLEAALCGCALLLNDIPTFREIWGDAAYYFHDGPSLDEMLSCVVSAGGQLNAMQRRAYKVATKLTARRMTEQYLSLYEQILHPTKEVASAV